MIQMANTKMKQDYECKFCGKKFHKESSLAVHVCVKKRRHAEANSSGPRMGLNVFVKFYQSTTASKKPKTLDDFINSPYYIEFVKFGHHMVSLKPMYPERFVEFILANGVKLKDWSKDYVYDLYVDDLIKREPPDAATDRSITHMVDWCNNNGAQFGGFFTAVSANEAASMVKSGKLSPWVLYLSQSGDALMSRFNEDHAKIIGNIIDPSIWMMKFKQLPDDVDYIRGLLEQVGV